MNLTTIIATIVASVFVAAGEDLTAYISARSRWTNDKISNAEPEFDRKLMGARLADGFRRGVLVALGAGVATTVTGGL